MSNQLRYSVSTLRAAGLEARWGRNSAGAPMLFARDPEDPRPAVRDAWWAVSNNVWETMKEHGVLEGFQRWTALAGFFSVPVRAPKHPLREARFVDGGRSDG